MAVEEERDFGPYARLTSTRRQVITWGLASLGTLTIGGLFLREVTNKPIDTPPSTQELLYKLMSNAESYANKQLSLQHVFGLTLGAATNMGTSEITDVDVAIFPSRSEAVKGLNLYRSNWGEPTNPFLLAEAEQHYPYSQKLLFSPQLPSGIDPRPGYLNVYTVTGSLKPLSEGSQPSYFFDMQTIQLIQRVFANK